MIVVEPGHVYTLTSYDGGVDPALPFLKRAGPGNDGESHPGTNCQEVLRALIDRVTYLNGQRPCEQNRLILSDLRDALWQFELRAAEARGERAGWLTRVNEWAVGTTDGGRPTCFERAPACETCGHVLCVIDHSLES